MDKRLNEQVVNNSQTDPVWYAEAANVQSCSVCLSS